MALNLLHLLLLFRLLPFTSADLESEARALQAFLVAITVPANTLNWSDTSQVCNWKGVECTNNTVVTALRLPGSGLGGEIPNGIFTNLTSLTALSLRSNRLSGTFPNDLSLCTQLRSIAIQNNDLSGTLRDDLFLAWSGLQRFDISFNSFSGNFPTSLSNLTRLDYLFLQNNSFEGPLPPVSSVLTEFNASYNRLNGPIPTALQRFNESVFIGNELCGPPLLSSPCNILSPPGPSPSSTQSPAPTPQSESKKLTTGQIIGIVIGSIAFFIFLLLLLFCICFLYKRKKATQAPGTSRATPPTFMTPGTTTPTQGPMMGIHPQNPERLVILQGLPFNVEDLLRASAEVLGKGSVGTAYKAKMDNPLRYLVVKRVGLTVGSQELKIIVDRVDRMRHPNLRPLLAYQYSEKSTLLMYEYMDMGSLSALLHGSKGAGRTPLRLELRYKIALATARGIAYLHQQEGGGGNGSSGFEYTHGNIKSSNVLLKSDGSVYVSDYGLTQMVAATTATSKMLGYKAPEVTELRRATSKSDVYSFGVLLLEVLTGKSPSELTTSTESNDLPWLVKHLANEGRQSTEVLDPDLIRSANGEQVHAMEELLTIAMECALPSPDQRPTMEKVVLKMESVSGFEAGSSIQSSSMLDEEVASSEQTGPSYFDNERLV